MKFSIVTPSYNQQEYIEDTIHSLLLQTYHNYEHIIIDGGSTDATLETVKHYASSLKNICQSLMKGRRMLLTRDPGMQ